MCLHHQKQSFSTFVILKLTAKKLPILLGEVKSQTAANINYPKEKEQKLIDIIKLASKKVKKKPKQA